MSFAWRFIGLLAASVAGLSGAAQAGEPLTEGVWSNPKGSVHIELKPCGANVCGYVVWANDKAQAAARRAGNDRLVGMQLLRDFERGTGGVQHGKVFAPDVNATFTGTAERIDARTLKAKGCLLAKVVCKTQIWTRIDTDLAWTSRNSAPPTSPK